MDQLAAAAKVFMKFRFDKANHIYYLNNSPLCGTTTILSLLSKELTFWASGQACAEFGWLNPKINDDLVCLTAAGEKLTEIKLMDIKAYRALLNKAYRAHSIAKDKAKDSGIDMHAALEDFIVNHMAGREAFMPDPVIQPFIDWSKKNVKRFLFSEICCFSEVLHTGGTADFAFEDMDENYVLGDFKSSATAYYSHYLQCGAYDLQISENGGWTPKGEKIFTLDKPFAYYAIFAARAGLDKPFIGRETIRLKKAFGYLARLYSEKLFWEENNK